MGIYSVVLTAENFPERLQKVAADLAEGSEDPSCFAMEDAAMELEFLAACAKVLFQKASA